MMSIVERKVPLPKVLEKALKHNKVPDFWNMMPIEEEGKFIAQAYMYNYNDTHINLHEKICNTKQ